MLSSGIAILAMIILITNASAFPFESIYVEQITGTSPEIDGELTTDEWFTTEEQFKENVDTLVFEEGSATEVQIELVMLKDNDYLYVLVTFLTQISDPVANGSMSVGIAFAPEPINLQMQNTLDRKIAYYNGENTTQYDLHKCSPCEIARDFQPGVDDADSPEFEAEYGKSTNSFFEFKIPLVTSNSEDMPITEGMFIKIVINPYGNIYYNGHGNIGSDELQVQFTPRSFFPRPEAGIDNASLYFNAYLGLIVSAIALRFLYGSRNEKLAKKLWIINITEDMANKSLLMEIAYYNSSFLSMTVVFFFGMESFLALLYGIWAGWGMIGYIFSGIPLLLSIITLVDLGKNNKNPQDEDYSKVGVEMSKSPKFWLIPALFLGNILLMLVIIGLNVLGI